MDNSKKIFKVNEYITLKLENRKTNIYIKDKKFIQCKKLLLNYYTRNINYILKADSVDNLKRYYKRIEGEKQKKYKILPETEFWAHCSNLQTWHENNYDTNLIHSNIGFPLLKALEKEGDIRAKRVIKEEVIKRIFFF